MQERKNNTEMQFVSCERQIDREIQVLTSPDEVCFLLFHAQHASALDNSRRSECVGIPNVKKRGRRIGSGALGLFRYISHL